LTDALLPGLFVFSGDMARVPADVNRLDNQVLVRYYENEWKRWN
jgi:spermidine synthase